MFRWEPSALQSRSKEWMVSVRAEYLVYALTAVRRSRQCDSLNSAHSHSRSGYLKYEGYRKNETACNSLRYGFGSPCVGISTTTRCTDSLQLETAGMNTPLLSWQIEDAVRPLRSDPRTTIQYFKRSWIFAYCKRYLLIFRAKQQHVQ